MKPVYTTDQPTREGMYWHVTNPDSTPSIVRVFRDSEGYWSVQYDRLDIVFNGDEDEPYDGIDFLQNYRGYWCRIPQPAKPEWAEPLDAFDTSR